jgi:large subunit ribosomal protein L9
MVLKEDVNNLGYRGDEVSVKAGFARNFLYPQKLAVYATPENRIKYKVDRESQDEAVVEKERALKLVISRIESSTVYFKRHTAKKGDVNLHTCVTYVRPIVLQVSCSP